MIVRNMNALINPFIIKINCEVFRALRHLQGKISFSLKSKIEILQTPIVVFFNLQKGG